MFACIPPRCALCRRQSVGDILLGDGPHVLRRVALNRLPLHAWSMARPHLHRKLHCPRAVRVFQRHRGESRTKTSAKVLASQRIRTRHTICNHETSLQDRQKSSNLVILALVLIGAGSNIGSCRRLIYV